MNQAERALDLLRQALGPAGHVRWSASDALEVELDLGGTWRFDVVSPEHESFGMPGTLALLDDLHRLDLERLRRNRVSFVSLRGAVRLDAPGLLVDRADLRPPRTGRTRPRRSAFSDKASLVPRWLFGRTTSETFTMSEIAEQAGVAPSVASYAIKDLEGRQVVGTEKAGRTRRVRLLDHRRLIEVWARAYTWRDNVSLAVHAPIGSPRRFMQRPWSSTRTHAWTLVGGASLLRPHAVVEDLHLYVGVASARELELFAAENGWVIDPGGRLHLLVPYYHHSVWHDVRVVDDVPVASSAQLIVDLWHYPLRGREQAEVLLDAHVADLG